jgi:aryl-alcohol dehydrogenase-like predicted oxidoreductase
VSQQSPYNLLDRRVEDELVPMAQRHGVGLLVWSPLAAGILAGRYTSPHDISPDSRAAILPALRARVNEEGLRVAAAVAELAAGIGLSPGQLALLWLRDQPGVTSSLVGPRSLDQLQESLVVADHPRLPAEVLAAIDELVPPGTTVSDFHNTSRWTGGLARLMPTT